MLLSHIACRKRVCSLWKAEQENCEKLCGLWLFHSAGLLVCVRRETGSGVPSVSTAHTAAIFTCLRLVTKTFAAIWIAINTRLHGKMYVQNSAWVLLTPTNITIQTLIQKEANIVYKWEQWQKIPVKFNGKMLHPRSYIVKRKNSRW